MRAVIVESFERIHRSNLVGMGVLPLQFEDGESRETLGLTGDERFTILGLSSLDTAARTSTWRSPAPTARASPSPRMCRIDTANEMEYYLNGGILQYVLRKLAA